MSVAIGAPGSATLGTAGDSSGDVRLNQQTTIPVVAASASASSSSMTTQPLNTNKRTSFQDLSGVRGAEGGVEAIVLRRRGSNSFKTMSTGSLVSNSPFTKRLGQQAHTAVPSNGDHDRPVSPCISRATTVYGSGSRIPTLNGGTERRVERKVSGGSLRRTSSEHLIASSSENDAPQQDMTTRTTKPNTLTQSRSTSPLMPFKPVRNASQSSTTAPMTSSIDSSVHNSRGRAVTNTEPARRETASFAALKKNGLVTSSPFVQVVDSVAVSTSSSPPLQPAPYEIAPLSHESAPFNVWTTTQTRQDHKDSFDRPLSPKLAATSLVYRLPQGPSITSSTPVINTINGDRRIAGSSIPPPNTPPHHRRSTSISMSPAATTEAIYGSPSKPVIPSALSPQRRGFKGPCDSSYDDDNNNHDARMGGRTLRRQPSAKTVTWAATEEVLEYEVDEDEHRRESGVSSVLSSSEDGDNSYGYDEDVKYYGHDDSFDNRSANTSLGFEEGGSVEVHDIDRSYYDYDDDDDDDINDINKVQKSAHGQPMHVQQVNSAYEHEQDDLDDDDDKSQVSTADSQVEDMIGVIDHFMSNAYEDEIVVDPLSPPSRTSPVQIQQSDDSSLLLLSPPFGNLVMQHHSEASSSSQAGSTTDDSTSLSSYGEDEEGDTTAKFDDALSSSPVPASLATATIQQAHVVTLASPIQLDNTSITTNSKIETIESPMLTQGFALPDIQKTSPFMPFEDDGAADSVVSLYMERNTQPLLPRRTPSHLLRNDDNHHQVPVIGLFGSQPLVTTQQHQPLSSPHLSRSGSIMSERASTVSVNDSSSSSWLESISSKGAVLDRNSSLNSGTGSLFMSRDRLQQKMKQHEMLLKGNVGLNVGSRGSILDLDNIDKDHGSFPTDLSSTIVPMGSMSSPSRLSTSVKTREVIQARPAIKATTATLSSDMIPTFGLGGGVGMFEIGTPLTEQIAAEMASPLERLQRGVDEKQRNDDQDWNSGDSFLGHGQESGFINDSDNEDGAKTRPKSQTLQVNESKRLNGRRRSSSTSDVPIAETTSIHEEEPKFKLPAHGFEHHLDAVLPGKGSGFSSTIEADLDDIFNSRDRSYRIHERRNVVYAADAFKTASDPNKAWRRKRPSNMHEVNRSLSMMSISHSASQRKPKPLSGQLFVILREAMFENLPMPQAKTSLRITLDNGKQKVEAGSRLLEKTVVIRSEFELVSSESLEFDITFHAPPKKIESTSTFLTPATPSSPTKSPSRGLRALLSSPKKRKAAEAAAAAAAATAAAATAAAQKSITTTQEPFDPFYDFVSTTGELATMHFKFTDEVSRCRLKRHRVNIPLEFKGMRKIARGALSIDLLYVPSVPGVPRNQLATSMDDAIKGMELAECESKVTHEGILTQLGGDTTVWRRRNFKLRSNRLVPYSEVTKLSHVEIDMSLVSRIRDLNNVDTNDNDSISTDREDDAMDHSFRLVFKDKSTIDLYADDESSKIEWMDVLNKLMKSPAVHRKAAPVWALTLRKLVAAGKV
ncbi:Bud site selection protein bud4 [Microbotryomycetes sp. JL221]|nr:Bud site selection protein bud4 [Microbotryomycetes sp. JL221]